MCHVIRHCHDDTALLLWQPLLLLLLLLPHPFNGLFSRTTWVSQYQKGKTSLALNKARDNGGLECNGISWTICKQSAPCSRQKTTTLSFFTGWMLFLTPNQQRQSTEVTSTVSQRLKLTELGAAVA